MPPRGQRNKGNNRVRQVQHLAAMSGGVLLAAAVLTITIAARMEITALSDETAKLAQELSDLRISERIKQVEYEQTYSLANIESRAKVLGMTLPSGLRIEFIDPPTEDLTVVLTGKDDKTMDKPKKIWEYFG